VSLPNLIRDGDDANWRRSVRDLVNMLVRRRLDQGATADRPRNPDANTMFVDTTLGKPVWFINGSWRDAAGTPA